MVVLCGWDVMTCECAVCVVDLVDSFTPHSIHLGCPSDIIVLLGEVGVLPARISREIMIQIVRHLNSLTSHATIAVSEEESSW